jgi:hypothetical protein
MICIAITPEAYEAIVATLPIGTVALKPKTAAQGMICWVWVERRRGGQARSPGHIRLRHRLTQRLAHP